MQLCYGRQRYTRYIVFVLACQTCATRKTCSIPDTITTLSWAGYNSTIRLEATSSISLRQSLTLHDTRVPRAEVLAFALSALELMIFNIILFSSSRASAHTVACVEQLPTYVSREERSVARAGGRIESLQRANNPCAWE